MQASEEQMSCVTLACVQFRNLSVDTDRSGINIRDDTATPLKDKSDSSSGMSPAAVDAMVVVSVVQGSDR